LFVAFLTSDLLATGGAVRLSLSERESFLAENHLPEGQGILPSVVWSRPKFWGSLPRALYARLAVLRENGYALITLLLVATVAGFARSLALARARRLSMRAAMDAATRLRRALHRQALRLGPSALDDSDPPQALVLFSEDVDRVRDGIANFVYRAGRHPLELALLAAVAVSIHWRLSLQCLVPIAFCWYLVQRERQRLESSQRLSQARAEAQLRLLAEGFRKTRIVRGYSMEEFEHERFQAHLERYTRRAMAVERGANWSRWLGWALITACAAIVLLFIGTKVLQSPETLSFAAAIALTATFACMHRPLAHLWRLGEERRETAVAADRIFRYLNRIPEVSQAVGAKFLQPLSKSLQLETVRYALPNKSVLLDGLDLKVRAGESIALISTNPLEARAVAYLLPRFIEPQSGRILFDGEDVAWSTLESLRAETIFVGGDDPFFTGTVLENISCGHPEYSLQQITEAAKAVHAHNFILRLPQGYETVIGEHGEQLNAGQALRLGLARAVLRKPALLIIEEPAETLDEDTKSLLDDAYTRIVADRTVIFLPSRLSTLRRADRIVLLHRGKVEETGTYANLVKSSPLYRHWEYVRFNEFRHELELTA
jgi:ABC-type multidrug transport system fused ATPase/permease subunit